MSHIFGSHISAAAGAPPPDPYLRLLMRPLIDFSPFINDPMTFNLGRFLDHLYERRIEIDIRRFLRISAHRNLMRALSQIDAGGAAAAGGDAGAGAAGGGALVDPEVVGQEALSGQRQRVTDNYTAMATTGPSAEVITRLLPAPENTDVAFNECFADLDRLYDIFLHQKSSDAVRFRLANAKLTLALINGDASIEHHAISRVERYSDFSYPGLPSTRQLMVLAWRLSKVDTREFVISTLAERCCTPAKWQAWKRPFGDHFREVLGFEDFGQSLSADQDRGNRFINAIVAFFEKGEALPAPGTATLMKGLTMDLLKKRAEKTMPVTEALLMVMRGHNARLLDNAEPNRPACEEGAYLGMLSAISEMAPGEQIFTGVTLMDCASIYQ